ncbi:uncharacterized protein ColSpa_12030 [Colletotrichum spaethianum]|uniref:Up-regulated in Daf-2 domain-containing protein n=1 Tax=Colletotrichum spaethianum TaxID=700344 RepID=A0AA37PGQ1_9PEZI|nr:uncharacterized protein ColSpa_12030 [Colletotrichum spaethianum]GKT51849.1 hypothetical protein ColSpa_12030 [Colletotrichum spaethianum]
MTKRTAFASVRNNTGSPIVAVSLVHKYSDDYKHQQQWGILDNGELGEEQLEVEYNTGAFTTGRDWWTVTWYSPDMRTRYYSDPENFRDIIDAMESVAPSLLKKAATTLAGLSSLTGPGLIAARIVAKEVAAATSDALFNSESTDGFKQHILRSEDEDALTEIVINNDNTITFKSNSGNSETAVSEEAVDLEE